MTTGEKRYLNSGLFIGFAPELYQIVQNASFPIYNDQKYFTEVYLDEKMRTNFKIGLDHRCEIFQNLEGDYNNMDLIYEGFKFIAFSSPVITGNNFSP